MRIKYLLNEEGRKDSLLKGGDGKVLQIIETEDVIEDLLKYSSVSESGEAEIHVGSMLCGGACDILLGYTELEDGLRETLRSYKWKKYFGRCMSIEELVEWENQRHTFLEELENRYSEFIDKINKEQEEKIKELNRKHNIEFEKFEKERDNWITVQGSQYLKDAFELGYNINEKYVVERAQKEFPDYDMDVCGDALYCMKDNPDEDSLNEVIRLIEQGFDAIVAELASYSDEDEEYSEECEAIVIRDYLGVYDLVKVL